MTNANHTDPTLKQLSGELTGALHQLDNIMAINRYQREALHAWIEQTQGDHTPNQPLLFGVTLTQQWQEHNERQLKQQLRHLQKQLP